MENEIKRVLTEIKSKLDQIWNSLVPLQQTSEEVRRLRTIMESRESLIPRFVESSPQIRTYGDMIDSIISPRHGPLEHNLYIMGYFDQITLDKLLPIARYVRIISPSKALENRINRDALNRMSRAGAQVRTHPMLHARIFCVPDRQVLIVGSGDLQTDCFGGRRFDAGVWSNYPELIKSAVDFFNRVWEESEPIPEASV